MELIVLGTGNGGDPLCYNTCFCLKNNSQYFLVDGGGGNQILLQLKTANINIYDIHDIFISHNHPDHILGIIWVLKRISGGMRKGKYYGDCRIYGSDESINAIKTMRDLLFAKKNIIDRVKFIVVEDDEEKDICGMSAKFFDTKANKAKQFGFSINDNFLVFTGDEPLVKENFYKFQNCKWLLHNAFCLESDKEKYNPHSMSHSTVKDSCDIANEISAKNLLMWHTEMKSLDTRKQKYTNEAKQLFDGNIYVPDDMEVIEL
ncbi:MAG TPA: MBL fold metallo-hydrolase [Clostridia bacterium]|nr:MBL fold metallo-hydrolase [Clostridia bacterium]